MRINLYKNFQSSLRGTSLLKAKQGRLLVSAQSYITHQIFSATLIIPTKPSFILFSLLLQINLAFICLQLVSALFYLFTGNFSRRNDYGDSFMPHKIVSFNNLSGFRLMASRIFRVELMFL